MQSMALQTFPGCLPLNAVMKLDMQRALSLMHIAQKAVPVCKDVACLAMRAESKTETLFGCDDV